MDQTEVLVKVPEETRPITEAEEVALGFPGKRGMLELDIYTVRDLAERLDIKELTIKQHIQKKKLIAVKFGGPTGYRILRNDIYAWLIGMQISLHDQKPLRKTYTRKNLSNGSGE